MRGEEDNISNLLEIFVFFLQKLTNSMDHKLNETKDFFWQEPQKKQLSSDGYCGSNDSYVKNQNRSSCYKNMHKVKWKSEHFWILALYHLHCGLREKRLCWYKTVPGYKI